MAARRSLRQRLRRLGLLLTLVGLLAVGATPVRANPCAAGGAPAPAPFSPGGDEGGIGGTGILDRSATGGIGGTGRAAPDEGGMGGTGLRPDDHAAGDDEGGISGTGVDQAALSTGIRGTITGFASICVGGTEIHYKNTTPVWIDGRPATGADLAVGQVVEVVASARGNEVRASEIHAEPIVAGPLTAVAGDHLMVAGQRVDVAPTTWLDAAIAAGLTALPLGTPLQVYGLRRSDGRIDASRLAPDPGAVVRLQGPVEPSVDAATRITIAGTPVEIPTAMGLAPGTQITVRGQWVEGVLVAATVAQQGAPAFFERVQQVEVEAYALGVDGGLDVGGIRVPVDGSQAVASLAGRRVKLTAEFDAARRVQVRSLVLARPRPVAPLRLDRPAALTRTDTTTVGAVPAGLGSAADGQRPPPQVRGAVRPLYRRGGGAPPGLLRPPLMRPPHLQRPPVPQRPRARPVRLPRPR